MYWLYLFFIIAPLEWTAAAQKWHKVRIFSKPLSLISLLLWFIAMGGFHSNGWWFGAGLFFSLVGDVFLLMRRRFFVAGLFSFFNCTHLLYNRIFTRFNKTISVYSSPGSRGGTSGCGSVSPNNWRCTPAFGTALSANSGHSLYANNYNHVIRGNANLVSTWLEYMVSIDSQFGSHIVYRFRFALSGRTFFKTDSLRKFSCDVCLPYGAIGNNHRCSFSKW